MSRKILIIADSRGLKLGDQLDEYNDFDYVVKSHRGADIEFSTYLSLGDIYTERPDLIIIMSGICQITKKVGKNKFQLRKKSAQKIVDDYMRSVIITRDMISYYCEQREIKCPGICFTTQTGADLKRQNKMKGRKKHPDQRKLNRIIYEINKCVVYINRKSGPPTIWLSKYTHRYHSKVGRYHSGYKTLKDGVHPKLKLVKYWAKEINRSNRAFYGLGPKNEKA